MLNFLRCIIRYLGCVSVSFLAITAVRLVLQFDGTMRMRRDVEETMQQPGNRPSDPSFTMKGA